MFARGTALAVTGQDRNRGGMEAGSAGKLFPVESTRLMGLPGHIAEVLVGPGFAFLIWVWSSELGILNGAGAGGWRVAGESEGPGFPT